MTIKEANEVLAQLLPESSFSIAYEFWNHTSILREGRKESGNWEVYSSTTGNICAPTLETAVQLAIANVTGNKPDLDAAQKGIDHE